MAKQLGLPAILGIVFAFAAPTTIALLVWFICRQGRRAVADDIARNEARLGMPADIERGQDSDKDLPAYDEHATAAPADALEETTPSYDQPISRVEGGMRTDTEGHDKNMIIGKEDADESSPAPAGVVDAGVSNKEGGSPPPYGVGAGFS
ncbi:hypothetical protein DFP72DRAFT_895003 [Ephemerocybe angulata]|uniref:Uncharacterized protein n=1 Tax=Ephemerocybe angulata TaxID=980116 RepID=A0A8H6I2J9_9AGAR|nr:hypothetical protein DFP72DRAFT_895003 [Tulosesus angulatus]